MVNGPAAVGSRRTPRLVLTSSSSSACWSVFLMCVATSSQNNCNSASLCLYLKQAKGASVYQHVFLSYSLLDRNQKFSDTELIVRSWTMASVP